MRQKSWVCINRNGKHKNNDRKVNSEAVGASAHYSTQKQNQLSCMLFNHSKYCFFFLSRNERKKKAREKRNKQKKKKKKITHTATGVEWSESSAKTQTQFQRTHIDCNEWGVQKKTHHCIYKHNNYIQDVATQTKRIAHIYAQRHIYSIYYLMFSISMVICFFLSFVCCATTRTSTCT